MSGLDADSISQERERFADGLHDQVLPLVMSLRQDLLELDSIAALGLVGRVDEITRTLRRMIRAEHPVLGQDTQLAEGLWEAAGPACRRAGLSLEIDADAHDRGCPHRPLTLACVRELAHNAARHAQASTLRVTVVEDDDLTFLGVADDGVGLDHAQLADRRRDGHLGLRRLQHRVIAAGGSVRIDGSARGTEVAVVLPRRS